MIVFLNGEYLNADEAKISIFDHGFLYGDGVYETLRTYNGKIWQPQKHLNRLKKSAKLIGIDLPAKQMSLKNGSMKPYAGIDSPNPGFESP